MRVYLHIRASEHIYKHIWMFKKQQITVATNTHTVNLILGHEVLKALTNTISNCLRSQFLSQRVK